MLASSYTFFFACTCACMCNASMCYSVSCTCMHARLSVRPSIRVSTCVRMRARVQMRAHACEDVCMFAAHGCMSGRARQAGVGRMVHVIIPYPAGPSRPRLGPTSTSIAYACACRPCSHAWLGYAHAWACMHKHIDGDVLQGILRFARWIIELRPHPSSNANNGLRYLCPLLSGSSPSTLRGGLYYPPRSSLIDPASGGNHAAATDSR